MKYIVLVFITILLSTQLISCKTTSGRQNVGMAAGGIAGGVAGSAITGGSTIGTVGGAVGGAFIGREVAK